MNIEPSLLSYVLEKGESIEWTGSPEPFPTINKYNKKSFILRCAVSIVAAAVLVICYAVAMKRGGQEFQILVPVILAAIVVFLIVRPYLDARMIRKKMAFLITDRNIICFQDERTFKKMALSRLDEVKIIHKPGGVSDVLFGHAAIKRPYSRIRLTTLMPKEDTVDDNTVVTGMAFYNIAENDRIRSLLPENVRISEENLI